jgi:hypothetical protein
LISGRVRSLCATSLPLPPASSQDSQTACSSGAQNGFRRQVAAKCRSARATDCPRVPAAHQRFGHRGIGGFPDKTRVECSVRHATSFVTHFVLGIAQAGLLNYTGSMVCFSRLLVLTRPRLRLPFAPPSVLQSSRSRLRWRHAQKEPTQNTDSESGSSRGPRFRLPLH